VPVCDRCGWAFLEGEQHVCAGERRVVVPVAVSVIAVVVPLALQAFVPLPQNAQVIGLAFLVSTLALGASLIWRAWRNVFMVIGYVIAMIPVSFLFLLWFGVKFLGQDVP
jgi:hypothetical protein